MNKDEIIKDGKDLVKKFSASYDIVIDYPKYTLRKQRVMVKKVNPKVEYIVDNKQLARLEGRTVVIIQNVNETMFLRERWVNVDLKVVKSKHHPGTYYLQKITNRNGDERERLCPEMPIKLLVY